MSPRIGPIASTLAALLLACGLWQPHLLTTSSVEGDASRARADDLSAAFREASAAVTPAVVHVQSLVRWNGRGTHPFERFFGPGDGPRRRERIEPDEIDPWNPGDDLVPGGMGTGVIVRSNGVLVTNHHVVENADAVVVSLQDGRRFSADVLGTDAETDLAVLAIDAHSLPRASFGDPDAAQVGDWVLAIGNPFGLDHTVTAGIVSAKGRHGVGVAIYEDFIQTDAAINPGNSGGPLIDLAGEVIGINTAIRSTTGVSMGIGFAIPATMVEDVMDDLLRHGRVSRGWLGVTIGPLSRSMSDELGWSGNGVVVTSVIDDGPAASAGMQAGDIVLSINGREVASPDDLMKVIAKLAPSSEADLRVVRRGRPREVNVELGERPPPARVR